MPLDPPETRDGWAFAGVNFAGKGFRFNLGARPRTPWDFNAKIHDIMYYVNQISFRLVPTKDWRKRSRQEKADYLFRIFSKQIPLTSSEKFLNNSSKLVFLGKDKDHFKKTDGFINIITLPQLSPENDYLMIPWSAIPAAERNAIEMAALAEAKEIYKSSTLKAIRSRYRINVSKRVKRRKGKVTRRESVAKRKKRIIETIAEEIKFNTKASVDSTDWHRWAAQTFGNSWNEAIALA